MRSDAEKLMSRAWALDTLIIVVVCAFTFFLGLGSRTLFSKDVARYAEIAREMIHFDSWWVPYFNGDVYANKPAPYMWLIAGPSLLIGHVNEWTARLPSALSAAGTVVITWLFGRRIGGRNAGLFSAVCLASCYQFVLLGRVSRTDMPFAFFLLAGLYFLYVGIQEPSRRGRSYILACIMAALSVLMKGPAGVIIMVLTAVGYALVKRDWRSLRSWSWVTGVILMLAIVAAWLVPSCMIGGKEFSRDLIFRQNLDRFAGEIDRAEPFYFYLYKLPLEIAPLNLLLPLVIVFYLGGRREKRARSTAFLLVYLAATFLLFEASVAKNIRYLLPMFPGIAILFGLFWDDLVSTWKDTGRSLKWTLAITGVVVGAAGVLAAFYMWGLTWIRDMYRPDAYGVALGLLMIGVLVASAICLRKSLPRLLLVWFCGVSMITTVFSLVEIDNIEGLPRQVRFARTLRDKSGGSSLYLYKYYRLDKGETRPAEFFYYGRYTPPVESIGELEDLRKGMSGGFYLLMLRETYDKEFAPGIELSTASIPELGPAELVCKGACMDEEIALVKMTSDGKASEVAE